MAQRRWVWATCKYFVPVLPPFHDCIRGMRIRVKDVLDLLAAKVPLEEIVEDYPYLESEDVAAFIKYAAAAIGGAS